MDIRNILWGLAFVIVTSCTDNVTPDLNEVLEIRQTVDVNNSNTRSYAEALAIAQNSISILDNHKNGTRGFVRKARTLNTSDYVIVSSDDNMTRSSNDAQCEADTLLYVFNFNDNDGFAVVSASKNTEGLLAITESGHYDPNDDNENEGFKIFMDYAKEYVKYRDHTLPSLPPIPFTELKDSTAVHEYYTGPYVEVRWGEEAPPENTYCSNGIAGCGPIAMAQAMSYFEYPGAMFITFPNADVTVQSLDWTEMKKHIFNDIPMVSYCSASQDAHNAIGRLCRQLGQLAGSVYSNSGTSTGFENMKLTLQGLGYLATDIQSYSPTPLQSIIQQNWIIFLSGSRLLNGNLVGHTWLLDGIYTREVEAFTFSRTQFEIEWTLVYYHVTSTTYYHFNWGADGRNNGYFAQNVFNSENPIQPDTTDNSYVRNYNIGVQYFAAKSIN